jgi:hypothetical protein
VGCGDVVGGGGVEGVVFAEFGESVDYDGVCSWDF